MAAQDDEQVRARIGAEDAGLGDPLAQWEVLPEHTSGHVHRMLSLLGRRRAGEREDPQEAQRLDAWVTGLREQGAVIDYRPSVPDGFFLVHAREGIDTDVVRRADR